MQQKEKELGEDKREADKPMLGMVVKKQRIHKYLQGGKEQEK